MVWFSPTQTQADEGGRQLAILRWLPYVLSSYTRGASVYLIFLNSHSLSLCFPPLQLQFSLLRLLPACMPGILV